MGVIIINFYSRYYNDDEMPIMLRWTFDFNNLVTLQILSSVIKRAISYYDTVYLHCPDDITKNLLIYHDANKLTDDTFEKLVSTNVYNYTFDVELALF